MEQSTSGRGVGLSCVVAAALAALCGPAARAETRIAAADLAAGRSLDHVLVQFDTGAVARAGLNPGGVAPLDATRRLGLPAGAWLRESPFTVSQRAEAGRPAAAAGVDLRSWVCCHRPPHLDVDALLAALRGNPFVVYCEPDHIGTGGFTPNDPSFTGQWHLRNAGSTNAVPPDIRATNAWDITRGSTNVILAVLDTGLDLTLAEFGGRVAAGYDYVNNDADPTDDHGHGTAVATTAAALGNDALRTAGVDWNCRVMPVKVLDAGNSGYYSWWASAINWARTHGAHVINLSAGGSSSDTTLSNAIMTAINAGVVFVTITHNDSTSTIRFPGRMRPCITVGATMSNDTRSSFSNYGPEIDLVAPGSGIRTVNNGGGIGTWNGTSFSAPLVSGVASLLLSLRPELRHHDVRTLLCASADDRVGNPAQDTAGFDNQHGWGRLNAHAALQLAQSRVLDVAATGSAATIRWSGPANAAQRAPFRIDYAGSPGGPWQAVTGSPAIGYSGTNVTWTDDGSFTGGAPGGATSRLYRIRVSDP